MSHEVYAAQNAFPISICQIVVKEPQRLKHWELEETYLLGPL
jgi:hypothetical protein